MVPSRLRTSNILFKSQHTFNQFCLLLQYYLLEPQIFKRLLENFTNVKNKFVCLTQKTKFRFQIFIDEFFK